MNNEKTLNIANKIPELLNVLKRDLTILAGIEPLGSSIITFKLVDAIDALTKTKHQIALDDISNCSALIYRMIYETLNIKTGNVSDKGGAAGILFDGGDFISARRLYISAIRDINTDNDISELLSKLD